MSADFGTMIGIVKRAANELEAAGYDVHLQLREKGKSTERFSLRTDGYLTAEEKGDPLPGGEPDGEVG